MNRMQEDEFTRVRQSVWNEVEKHAPNELRCHIQFVEIIGARLSAVTRNVDAHVVRLGCLLHDIGRDRSETNADHPAVGADLAEKLLLQFDVPIKIVKRVVGCVLNHDGKSSSLTDEEKLVVSADGGSKVEFHSMFLHLCKKTTPLERANWGRKHLIKGFEKIRLESYKQEQRENFESLENAYRSVLE